MIRRAAVCVLAAVGLIACSDGRSDDPAVTGTANAGTAAPSTEVAPPRGQASGTASPGSGSSAPAEAELRAAAEQGDAVRVRALLAAGANPDARDGRGTPLVLVATQENRVGVATALIEAGADVNAKDSIEDSAYLYAAAEGRLEILELTLWYGADLRSLNRYGGTGLIPAAHHGHVEAVRRLLRTEIDVDHVNNLGWTALLEAVILGTGGREHTEIVRLLVDAGANVSIADRAGVTALEHARRRGFSAIVRILEGP